MKKPLKTTYIFGFGNASSTNKNYQDKIVFFYYSRFYIDTNKDVFYGIINLDGKDISLEWTENNIFYSTDKKASLKINYSSNNKIGILTITKGKSKFVSKKLFFHDFSG